jgi:hypothetical protein
MLQPPSPRTFVLGRAACKEDAPSGLAGSLCLLRTSYPCEIDVVCPGGLRAPGDPLRRSWDFASRAISALPAPPCSYTVHVLQSVKYCRSAGGAIGPGLGMLSGRLIRPH